MGSPCTLCKTAQDLRSAIFTTTCESYVSFGIGVHQRTEVVTSSYCQVSVSVKGQELVAFTAPTRNVLKRRASSYDVMIAYVPLRTSNRPPSLTVTPRPPAHLGPVVISNQALHPFVEFTHVQSIHGFIGIDLSHLPALKWPENGMRVSAIPTSIAPLWGGSRI